MANDRTTAATLDPSFRWKVLAVAYLAALTFAFTLQALPPVLTLIIERFELSHAEAGLVMSLFATPMIFLSIPAGFLLDRLGARSVGLVAFTLTIVGTLLVASTPSYPILLAGRALAGIGALSLVILAPHMISEWFTGKELGTAMGLFNTAMPLGTIVSLSTMGSIGQAFGWRVPPLIGVGFAVLSMVVFVVLNPRAPRPEKLARAWAGGRIRFTDVGFPIWMVGLAWLFFNAATIPFMSFGPDYFLSVGYSVDSAGLLAGTIMWGSLPLAPLVGMLLDRGLSGVWPIALAGVMIAVALVLIPAMPWQLVPALVLLTVGNAMVPAAIFAFPPRLMEPRVQGLGFGILSSLLNVGIFVGPFAAGVAHDYTGGYTASFWVMSALAVLISASILPVARLRSHRLAI